MAIDWTKPVWLPGSQEEYRVLCTDAPQRGAGQSPVILLTQRGEIARADLSGLLTYSGAQLTNVPETKVFYLNIYPGRRTVAWFSRDEADGQADNGRRQACVRVEYREGQLDE